MIIYNNNNNNNNTLFNHATFRSEKRSLKHVRAKTMYTINKLQAVVWEIVNMQFVGELTQMGNRLGRSMRRTSCESSERTEKRTNAV